MSLSRKLLISTRHQYQYVGRMWNYQVLEDSSHVSYLPSPLFFEMPREMQWSIGLNSSAFVVALCFMI